MLSNVVAFPRTTAPAASPAHVAGTAPRATAAPVAAIPSAPRAAPARPTRLTRAVRARASRTPALFRQFRALSERLGRDDAAQREALGLDEAAWRDWVAAEARGEALDDAGVPELAGHLAWQNYLALGLLAATGRLAVPAEAMSSSMR